jgi:hypothetical protein
MKVTVIATGFPTDMPKRSLFQASQSKPTSPTINNLTKEEVVQSIKKDINKNDSTDFTKKIEKTEDDLFIDDTDDWSTVPAFLRRNKK